VQQELAPRGIDQGGAAVEPAGIEPATSCHGAIVRVRTRFVRTRLSAQRPAVPLCADCRARVPPLGAPAIATVAEALARGRRSRTIEGVAGAVACAGPFGMQQG